jgi:hypothetical protein
MEEFSASQAAIPGLSLVEKLLGPTAEKLGTKLKDWGEVTWHNLFNSLEDHLQRSLERNSFFTSVIFPNQQKRLDDYWLLRTFKILKLKQARTISLWRLGTIKA